MKLLIKVALAIVLASIIFGCSYFIKSSSTINLGTRLPETGTTVGYGWPKHYYEISTISAIVYPYNTSKEFLTWDAIFDYVIFLGVSGFIVFGVSRYLTK